mgnify:CR=1 FL=1
MKRDDNMAEAIKAVARQIPKDIETGLIPLEAFGMTDNASPRPWRIKPNPPRAYNLGIYDANDRLLVAADAAKATRALIVKAVNSHDALVEALGAARIHLEWVAKYGLEYRPLDATADCLNAIEIGDAALALARGEATR